MTPGTQVNGGRSIGDAQPPRNRIVVIAHISWMATYSPSMNSRYGVDEYSTMKPATSSDSASGRSKGGRLVSASAEMKNTMNIGNSGSQNQSRKLSHGTPSMWARPIWPCATTMSLQVQRAHAEQHRDDHEADRDFVGHHLRGRAQRAEEGVFRVRRPAGHDDAVDAERGDGEDVEDADIDVGDRPAGVERNHHPGRERQQPTSRAAPAGTRTLSAPAGITGSLNTNFRRSAKLLQQAERADDVGAAAHLHRRPDLAVGEQDVGGEDQQRDEEQQALVDEARPASPQPRNGMPSR